MNSILGEIKSWRQCGCLLREMWVFPMRSCGILLEETPTSPRRYVLVNFIPREMKSWRKCGFFLEGVVGFSPGGHPHLPEEMSL